jgi:hypothetical protein|tara:strand:- start:5684 stop:5953 length:270 start_codon:yes stop_codon:yes gene_type:complete
MTIPQTTGHKYKYVGSLDIVDTDKKYIKELERTVEEYFDYWDHSVHEWKEVLWPMITSLRLENRQLKAEIALLKKGIDKAKRLTNQKLD